VDDKAKIPIGVPAVSKLVKSKKYFIKGKGPVTPDHDFPLSNELKITPSGYLELIPNNKIEQDNYGRTKYQKPISGNLHVFNRAQMFDKPCITNHIDDLIKVISTNKKFQDGELKMLGIIVDGGPNISPNFLPNLVYYGRLWKMLGLCQLFIVSHAPYHSRYFFVF